MAAGDSARAIDENELSRPELGKQEVRGQTHLLDKKVLSGVSHERDCQIELKVYQETVIKLDG